MDTKELTNKPIPLFLIFLLVTGYSLDKSDLDIWDNDLWISFLWMFLFVLLIILSMYKNNWEIIHDEGKFNHKVFLTTIFLSAALLVCAIIFIFGRFIC